MAGTNDQPPAPSSKDNTYTGHRVTKRSQDIILLILLLLVTFSDHSVTAESFDITGCQFTIQKGVSSDKQPFEGHVTRGYVINSLKLMKQISSQQCQLGITYGYTLTTWWVKYGCAAKFKIQECLIPALIPTESTGDSPEVNEYYKSNRQHFKFEAASISPGGYPSQRRKDIQWTTQGEGRRKQQQQQHSLEVESSGNISPFVVETKSDTTTVRIQKSNKSPPTLQITTLLLVVTLGTHTLL